MAGKAAHVKLVDHGLGERALERQVAFPVIAAGIGHDTFHRRRRIVAGPARGFSIVVFGDRDGETIRVEKNLLAIEPKTAFRREWSMGAIAINLARLEVRDKDMPVVIGAVSVGIERDDLCRLCGILVIE